MQACVDVAERFVVVCTAAREKQKQSEWGQCRGVESHCERDG